MDEHVKAFRLHIWQSLKRDPNMVRWLNMTKDFKQARDLYELQKMGAVMRTMYECYE